MFLVHFFSFAEDDVRKHVSPHFLSGLLSLESFVQVLEKTRNDVSAKAAQRIMPYLLGFVITSHKAFCLASTAIHQINDRLDNNRETVTVEEKIAKDSLTQILQSLEILKEKVKLLQDECDELKEQLSKLDLNLEKEKESLRQIRKRLKIAKRGRMIGVPFGLIVGGILVGPIGLVVGGAAAMVFHSTIVSKVEQAVNEISNQVASTQRSFDAKNTELGNLKRKQEHLEKEEMGICQNLKWLQAKSECIKESQRRLAKLNDSIKRCTTFVDTTASRAKVMADEAYGELPDIEAMVPPLKAIASDIAAASLSDTRLLSGRVDMKGIGAKIKAITSKAGKSVTCREIDKWV